MNPTSTRGMPGIGRAGETHFRVYIVAEAFRGKSRLERHRMVNETLSGELAGGVHALAIHASAPGEGRLDPYCRSDHCSILTPESFTNSSPRTRSAARKVRN